MAIGTAGTGVPATAGDLSIHGFGTVGVAYLDKPADWAYTRSVSQRASAKEVRADLDSVVGLQVNYSPTGNVELVGQAAAARLDRDADADDYLELAFVAWRPDPDWRVRLGRINLDAYLISEHRDVGFTYQFIRPPPEFYSHMPTSLDGADVERTWTSGEAHWQAKLFTGHTEAGGLRLWPLFGVMVAREDDGLLLRLSVLRARPDNDVAVLVPLQDGLRQMQGLPIPQVAAEARHFETVLETKGVQTHYLAAAAAYDRHGWLLNVEVNRGWARDESAINFSSGYISVGRRFGALSAFVMESAAIRDQDVATAPDWGTVLAPYDPVLAQQAQTLAAGAALAVNKSSAHQFTTSAGVRWDVTPRLALKAQIDRIRTRRDGDGLWLSADGGSATSHVFALAADFVF